MVHYEIKVLRNGSEIATVDFYQYMLTGKCTTDVRLQNNDVVFVPSRVRPWQSYRISIQTGYL